MKIGFWSMLDGQATTTNMAAIATVMAVIFGKKTVMLQSHFEWNSLEQCFLPISDVDSKREYYMDIGYDAMVRHMIAGTFTESTLKNCITSVSGENLALLSGTKQLIKNEYHKQAQIYIPYLLRALEQEYELVFVDMESGRSQLSRKLMKEIDLLVINLRQNFGYREELFQLCNEMPQDKKFYLFGMYDNNSRNSLKNIRRIEKDEFSRSNTAVIPYNTAFGDAATVGQLLSFAERNQNAKKDEKTRIFIDEVKNAANRMMEFSGRERTKSYDVI